MDRRLLKSNGRVAHSSLKGQVEAERFVDGENHPITSLVADLCALPSGARDRQMLRGETFIALTFEGDWVFGFSEKDGYVGWIEATNLISGTLPAPTHRVSAHMSYAKTTPGLKDMGRVMTLPFGCVMAVSEQNDGWARVAWERGTNQQDLFVPCQHLRPIDMPEPDTAAVAERFLGSPYLWGGNSAFGIDCSGLVQAALLTCGIPCPGDSDLQEDAFPDATSPFQRGDLLFWKGHVAMVVDADTLIHANAHHMAVAYENIDTAIVRIAKQGDGPVTSHKRPARKEGP